MKSKNPGHDDQEPWQWCPRTLVTSLTNRDIYAFCVLGVQYFQDVSDPNRHASKWCTVGHDIEEPWSRWPRTLATILKNPGDFVDVPWHISGETWHICFLHSWGIKGQGIHIEVSVDQLASSKMDLPCLLSFEQRKRLLACLLLITAGIFLLQQQQPAAPPTRPARPAQIRRRRKKRIWAREWLTRRSVLGDFEQLMEEMNKEDERGFRNFMRIKPDLFQELVHRLTPRLKKMTTNMRSPLPVGLKLAVTLRFLATGDSFTSLQYSFRVSKSAISRFLPLVCQAIIDTFKDEFLKCPRTPEDWKKVISNIKFLII